MNRRDFLHPRQLAQTAGQVVSTLQELQQAAPEPPPRDIALLRVARRAMATEFEVLLPYGTPRALAAAESALDWIDRLEDQLTVYRPHSEVSRLNRLAADAPVAVETRLFSLLTESARLTHETDGAFDVSVGALIKSWGFYRRQGRVPPPAERAEAMNRAGMDHVLLDADNRTVRFARPGLEINLGSIGKGYALDRAAEVLREEWNLSSALLHGGHSSVYAIGSEPEDSRGWAVGVQHPSQPEKRLAIVRIRNQALATSAATYQYLEHEGRRLGHLLDPRSGWPAEGIASATAIAPTAAEADALATAFFVLGVGPTRRYCQTRPDVGAILLPEGADSPLTLGPGVDDGHR